MRDLCNRGRHPQWVRPDHGSCIQELRSFWVDQNPFQIETIFQKMTRDSTRRRADHRNAVAAIRSPAGIVGKALNNRSNT